MRLDLEARDIVQPQFLGPGSGRHIRLPGGNLTVMLAGTQTGGQVAVVEYHIPAEAQGTVPVRARHVHPGFSHCFYVLEGEVAFAVGTDTVGVEAGGLLFLAGDTPHAFWNGSASEVRFLLTIAPAGLEDYFLELSALPDPEGLGRKELLELEVRLDELERAFGIRWID